MQDSKIARTNIYKILVFFVRFNIYKILDLQDSRFARFLYLQDFNLQESIFASFLSRFKSGKACSSSSKPVPNTAHILHGYDRYICDISQLWANHAAAVASQAPILPGLPFSVSGACLIVMLMVAMMREGG